MTDHATHAPPTFERHCDVAVIGGSVAGLAAALQLGRQRRSVMVIDSCEPRNAPAAHLHSYLGYEGQPPETLLGAAREEVRSYGGEVLPGRAIEVTRVDAEHFRIDLIGGSSVIARRVLAATGLVDDLPAIDGLAEHWGRDVIHCPFCHGYEVRDGRIVQIVTHPMGLHTAPLFRQLTNRLTIVLHDGVDPDDPEVEALRNAGVTIVNRRVQRIVAGADGRVAAVETDDGARIDADAVVVGGRFHVRAEILESLGVIPVGHPTGLGDHLETDPTGETSVTGLYAAGNITDPAQQLLQAAANGSWVGGMISVSLAREDLEAAGRPSPNQTDWDRRYSGDQIWSGNPNGSLVAEVGHLEAGRALDVGTGEGGDAIWLAERGWQVTASDISPRALQRVTAAAVDRGVEIECRRADANADEPFERGGFDLVSAQYASIPRTPDGRGVTNVVDAVATGGTLLVVSHDLEPMRTPIDTTRHSRPFDPDAYVRVDDFVELLGGSPDWDIEVHATRPRGPGSASASHHVDDVVLRARRL